MILSVPNAMVHPVFFIKSMSGIPSAREALARGQITIPLVFLAVAEDLPLRRRSYEP